MLLMPPQQSVAPDRRCSRAFSQVLISASAFIATQAAAIDQTVVSGSACRAHVLSQAADLSISGSAIVNTASEPRVVVCDITPSYPARDSIHYEVGAQGNRSTAATGDAFECAIAVASSRPQDSGLFSSAQLSITGRLSVTTTALKRDGDATVQVRCVLPAGTRLDQLDIEQHPID